MKKVDTTAKFELKKTVVTRFNATTPSRHTEPPSTLVCWTMDLTGIDTVLSVFNF